MRLVGLPFEGFLEALCRVAVLKALPTDEEITAGGYMHAGDMLVCLRDDDPPAYKALIRAHANPWGAWAVEGGLRQPTCRCVEHVLTMIIHTIEVSTRGEDDLLLTEKECASYFGNGGAQSPGKQK